MLHLNDAHRSRREIQEVGFHFDEVSSVVYGIIVDLNPRVPHQIKSRVTYICVILSHKAAR